MDSATAVWTALGVIIAVVILGARAVRRRRKQWPLPPQPQVVMHAACPDDGWRRPTQPRSVWWQAPVSEKSRAAMLAYASRAVIPRLRRGDRADFAQTLQEAMQGGAATASHLGRLREYLHRSELGGDGAGGGARRASRRGQEVVVRLPPGARGPYIDLGGGDSSITQAVGEALQTPATCVDVGPRPARVPPGVHWISAEDMGRLGDGEFGVATALMSLHHIENLEGALCELARVVRPGGALVVREHDLTSSRLGVADARQFLDWVHIVYDLAEGVSVGAFEQSRFRHPCEWDGALASAGFRRCVVAAAPPNRPDGVYSYYATYLRANDPPA